VARTGCGTFRMRRRGMHERAWRRRGPAAGDCGRLPRVLRSPGAILAAGASDDGQREARIFNAALAGHRAFQGGRGSGYDVAVSLHGGPILFRGGSRPRYESIALPWLPPFAFVRGSRSVSTRQSVAAYEDWKRSDPERASRYLAESNRLVETFARSSSWDAARPIFDAFARHTAAFGRAIGSPGDIVLPGDRGEMTGKAVGAGNELSVVFLDPVTDPDDGVRAPVRPHGGSRVRTSSRGMTIDGQAVAGGDAR
jgi:hypothetical protein